MTFGPARTAVFVDGCFWHGCPVHYTQPRANEAFWQEKLRRNRARDAKVDTQLVSLGWLPVRIWEHEIYEDLHAVVARVRDLIASRRTAPVSRGSRQVSKSLHE